MANADPLNNSLGYNPHRWVELHGGTVVPTYNYEPGAKVFRGLYYYNSRLNQLFKRELINADGDPTFAYWKVVSEPI